MYPETTPYERRVEIFERECYSLFRSFLTDRFNWGLSSRFKVEKTDRFPVFIPENKKDLERCVSLENCCAVSKDIVIDPNHNSRCYDAKVVFSVPYKDLEKLRNMRFPKRAIKDEALIAQGLEYMCERLKQYFTEQRKKINTQLCNAGNGFKEISPEELGYILREMTFFHGSCEKQDLSHLIIAGNQGEIIQKTIQSNILGVQDGKEYHDRTLTARMLLYVPPQEPTQETKHITVIKKAGLIDISSGNHQDSQ